MIKIIDHFYKEKINSKTFTENNMNKFFYYDGKQAVIDILNYKIFKSKKSDRNLIKLIEQYKNKTIPVVIFNIPILDSSFALFISVPTFHVNYFTINETMSVCPLSLSLSPFFSLVKRSEKKK